MRICRLLVDCLENMFFGKNNSGDRSPRYYENHIVLLDSSRTKLQFKILNIFFRQARSLHYSF